MKHMNERKIALMVSEVVGPEELIECYFTNDSVRITQSLENKLGKEVVNEFLGKSAINLRTDIFPSVQETVTRSFPLQTSLFDLNIDYSQEVAEPVLTELEPVVIESRVR